MPPRRYNKKSLTSVDEIYQRYAQLAKEEKKEHHLKYLADQSEAWRRLYPQTYLVVSGVEHSSESTFQSPSGVGKGSPSNIASICHQPTQESPSSSTSRGTEDIAQSGSSGQQPSQRSLITGDTDCLEETASNFGSGALFKLSQQAAKVRLVEELECIVKECDTGLNVMPTWSLEDSAEGEHLRTFLTQITEKFRLFYENMKESLTEISKLELSPILNVSSLSMLNLNVLNAAIDVENVWREFAELRNESSIADMLNMTQHYYWCWQYYEAYQEANQRYLSSLPEKSYPIKRENFSIVP